MGMGPAPGAWLTYHDFKKTDLSSLGVHQLLIVPQLGVWATMWMLMGFILFSSDAANSYHEFMNAEVSQFQKTLSSSFTQDYFYTFLYKFI